jgi:hypothetical protein
VTLIKGCKSVKVVSDTSEVPEGCGSVTLTQSVTEYVLVRGQVDIDIEISKTEKKLGLARMNLEKIVKIESQADYAQTVPENVRLQNEDKVHVLEHYYCLDVQSANPALFSLSEENLRGRGGRSGARERDVCYIEVISPYHLWVIDQLTRYRAHRC